MSDDRARGWPSLRGPEDDSEGFANGGGGTYGRAVVDVAELTKARSLLILLLATCKQTQLALEAVANVLDTDLRQDLGTMIDRSEHELKELSAKIDELSET